ncbi:MAG: hypothetical protein IID17_08725 [Nitrospinae bacterium]|nr:hypothetical protein [Nitrospinota bacterium]
MNTPLIDYTTLVGIESLFRDGPCDPWAEESAGKLADLFIYSEKVRYGIGVPTEPWAEDDLPSGPTLIRDLARRDSDVFLLEQNPASEPLQIKDNEFNEFFQNFKPGATANQVGLRKWISLHQERWVREFHKSLVKRQYVFSLEKFLQEPKLEDLERKIGIEIKKICYILDTQLKYAIYAKLVGKNNFYLCHPIRGRVQFPIMERQRCDDTKTIPLSFEKYFKTNIKGMTQDEYTT